MLYSHVDIKAVMPHRYPMLLVDAITSLERWTSIVGVKNVTGTEACYARLGEGASPRDYAYPCSLMIESFGQTGGVLINEKRKHEEAPEDVIMLFVGVSGFRFLGEVFPGDTMEHRVVLEKDMSDFAILGGEILVRDRVIAEIDSIIVAYKPASMIATARRS